MQVERKNGSAIVYLEGPGIRQIVGWKGLDRCVRDYPEYARGGKGSFHSFDGPPRQQERRAELLAKELDVPIFKRSVK